MRLLVLGGIGMLLVGSSHPGSGGEHAISHYLDMLLRPHPGSLHGEQVGIASLTTARLQAAVLAQGAATGRAPGIDAVAMRDRYGPLADDCLAAMSAKTLDAERARALNVRLEERWPDLRRQLQDTALPPRRLEGALREAGAATRPEDLGIDPPFYRQAVLHARKIRGRYTMLDLAADAGLLEDLVERRGSVSGSG